jgi:hypothetical protein
MKPLAWIAGVVLALGLVGSTARAEDPKPWRYDGYQPWWNIFKHRNKTLMPEEERLQRFWHDYYDSLRRYYANLDRVDWVAYYKNHGYQINQGCSGPGCGCQRIQFAPVFVNPNMQWAVPSGAPAKLPTVPDPPGK